VRRSICRHAGSAPALATPNQKKKKKKKTEKLIIYYLFVNKNEG